MQSKDSKSFLSKLQTQFSASSWAVDGLGVVPCQISLFLTLLFLCRLDLNPSVRQGWEPLSSGNLQENKSKKPFPNFFLKCVKNYCWFLLYVAVLYCCVLYFEDPFYGVAITFMFRLVLSHKKGIKLHLFGGDLSQAHQMSAQPCWNVSMQEGNGCVLCPPSLHWTLLSNISLKQAWKASSPWTASSFSC